MYQKKLSCSLSVLLVLVMLLSLLSAGVLAAPGDLTIGTQPQSITVASGSYASFSVAASGGEKPYHYQWEFYNADSGWMTIQGATDQTYTIGGAAEDVNGFQYRCTVTDNTGSDSVTSDIATLTVVNAPVISGQPQSVTVTTGGSVSFSVTAAVYSPPITCQWENSTDGGSNWTAIEGAAGAEYHVAGTTEDMDGWQYHCIITDHNGFTISDAATLTVSGEPGSGKTTQPDLIVREIVINAKNVEAGNTVSVAALVYNAGGVEIEAPFKVRLCDGGTPIGEQTVASLAASSGQEVDFNWTPAQAGEHTLKAVADSGSEILEAYESNNEKDKTATVGGWANITVLPAGSFTSVNLGGIWQSPAGGIYMLYRYGSTSGNMSKLFKLNTVTGLPEEIYILPGTGAYYLGGDTENLYFGSGTDIYKYDGSGNLTGPMNRDKGTSGGTISAFWNTACGQTYASGSFNTISGKAYANLLKLNPGNQRWELMPTNDAPSAGINPKNFGTLWGTGPDNIYAAGNSGFVTHYDGSTWSSNLAASLNLSSITFYGIWGSSATDVYVAGSSGTILHYNGISWEKQTPSPVTANLTAVTGTGPNAVYAFGANGTVIHYDGTGWTNLTSTLSTKTGGKALSSSVTDPATGSIYAVCYNGTLLEHISGVQTADLTVDRISADTVGDTTTVNVTVKNTGRGDAPAGFQVKLYTTDDPGGAMFQTVNAAVTTGSAVTVPFTWTLPEDQPSLTFQAVADSGNTVTEYNKDNNTKSLTIPLARHTLTLTAENGAIQGAASGDTFLDGARVSLTAVPAGGYIFKEWQGGLSGSNNPAAVTMDGDRKLTAVFEQVRNDLAVTSLTPAPLSDAGTPVFYQGGGVYYIKAAVENPGNVPTAAGAIVSLYEGDNPQPAGTAAVSGLQPNGTQTVDVLWIPSEPGSLTLKAKAAFADGTADADTGNNSATCDVTVVPGVPLPVQAMSGSGGPINDIAGASENSIFAATTNTILRYTGGGKWSPCGGVAGKSFLKLWVDSDSEAYALAKTTRQSIYSFYKYDGQFWQEIPGTQKDAVNEFGSQTITAYWKSPDNVFYLAVRGTIHKYDTASGTWTAETLPDISTTVRSMWGTSSFNIYAAANDALYHYDGTSWSADSSFSVGSLWGTGADDLYWYGGAAIRHYDGSGWETLPGTGLPSGSSANVNSLCKASSGTLYAVCGSSLFQHSGNQWQRVSLSGMSGTPKAVYRPIDDCLLVVDNNGSIYYSGSALDIGGSDGPAPAAKTVSMKIMGVNTAIPWTTVTVDNFDMTPYLKAGTINSDQPTVFHALVKVLQANGYDPADFAHVLTIANGYASMILNEKAEGMAGWMYVVNGWTPNYGAAQYKIREGDEIIWFYGGYGAIMSLPVLNADKTYIRVGDSVTFTRTDNYYASDPASGGTLSSLLPKGQDQILLNGVSVGSVNSQRKFTYAFTWPGTYTVQDQYGLAAPLTVTVLENAPGATPVIATNASGKTIAETEYTFKASAEDGMGKPVGLTVKVNGKETYNQLSATVYSVKLLPGNNTLELFAQDDRGHRALKTYTIRYLQGPDTTPPAINTSVTAGRTVSSRQYVFTATALDDRDGTVPVQVRFNGQTVSSGSGGNYTVALTKGSSDTITISAVDAAGNHVEQSYAVTYTPEEQRPPINEAVSTAISVVNRYLASSGYTSDWTIVGQGAGKQAVASGYLNGLAQTVDDYFTGLSRGETEKVTDPEKWTLSILAAGGDPRNFHGHDLVSTIYNFYYKSRDITFQGLNGVIFGLIALDSDSYVVPADARYSRNWLISYLLDNQNSDGGWDLAATGTSDVDITSMTLQALAPYYARAEVETAADKAMAWLSDHQRPDGGFYSTDTVNSEAISQAVIALCANGIDPASDSFTKNGKNLLDALLAFQLPNGSFRHIMTDTGDYMATEQAYLAMLAYDRFVKAGEVSNGGKTSIYYFGTVPSGDKTAPVIITDLTDRAVTASKLTFTASANDAVDGSVLPVVKVGGKIISGKNGAFKAELGEGSNTVTITAADYSGNKAEKSFTVTYNPNSQELPAGDQQPTIEIPRENGDYKIPITAGDNNKEVSIQIPGDKESKVLVELPLNAALPKIEAVKGNVTVVIPKGTQVVSGDASAVELITSEDPTDPEIAAKVEQALPAGKTLDEIAMMFSMGGSRSVEFSQFITLTFTGMSGRDAAYIQGDLHLIQKYANDLRGLSSGKNEYAYDSGNDLIVKTKHFTGFIAYASSTKTTVPGGGVPVTKQCVTLSVDKLTIGKGYVLSSTGVELQPGDTAWTVLKRELDKRGISCRYELNTQYDSVYVQSIDGEGEFDHGKGSGWMYSVNGVYPGYGASKYTLKDGDIVKWRYTTNLGTDLGTDNSRWEDVTTVPVTAVPGAAAEMEITRDADGKATVTVEGDTLSSLLKKAREAAGSSKALATLTVEVPEGAETLDVVLSKKAVSALAEAKNTALRISSGLSELTFDVTAAAAVAAAAGPAGTEVTITVAVVPKDSLSDELKAAIENRPIYDFSVSAGNTAVSAFEGGRVRAGMPYAPSASEDKNAIVVCYINDRGGLELVKNGRYDAETGLVYFSANHLGRYAVGYNKKSFTDIGGKWMQQAVEYMAARGVIEGVDENKYAPDEKTTRGQFASMLMRMLTSEVDTSNTKQFSDVAAGKYYADAVLQARALGLVEGVENGCFNPDETITREQMFTITYRALERLGLLDGYGKIDNKPSFSDRADISGYAAETVDALAGYGLVSGSEGKLNPKGLAGRAECAQFLYNVLTGMN